MTLNFLTDTGIPIPGTDVQNTTFSVEPVARFVCNTWNEIVAAQGTQSFDVVVIGSGMYGGYCATKLFSIANRMQADGEINPADKPRILVLESGPFLIDEHIQNLTRSFFGVESTVLQDLTPAQPNTSNFSQHHRCIGGKSLFWGGWAPRLTDADLAQPQWPQAVVDYLNSPPALADGYRFVLNEIGAAVTADFVNGNLNDVLLNRAQTIVASGAVPTLTQAESAPIAVLGQAPVSGLFSMDKFSSLPLLIDSLRDDRDDAGVNDQGRRLFLVPRAEVIKLDGWREQGRVTQIVVALRENPASAQQVTRVVRLDLKQGAIVVLAGNTINSTRLALDNFPRPETLAPGGNPGNELMGRNLMAHVRGNFFWRIHRNALQPPGAQPLTDELRTAALNIRGETGPLPSDPALRGRFHFQTYATGPLERGPFGTALSDPEAYLYKMVPNLEDLQDILAARQADWIVLGIRTCGETFGNKNVPPGNPNLSWMNLSPVGGAAEVFFEQNQPITVRRAFVNLVETASDQDVRAAQTEAAKQFVVRLVGLPAGSDAFADVPGTLEFLEAPIADSGEDPIGSTYHESGTLWMGDDPNTSVTDVNGRFHHVANACCVDQSLFPTVGSANPVPTGLTLSRMVVRHLLSRYVDTPNTPIQPGFTSLYNGSFGSDWQVADANRFSDAFDDPANPFIEAGTDGPGELGILFFATQTFANFELQIDWKAFTITANSGVFLRLPQPPPVLDDAFYDSAIEVQIDERGFNPDTNLFGSPLHRTGAVYEALPARQWASKTVVPRFGPRPGFWNRFQILLQNNNISVRLNGKLISEGQLPANKLQQGFIGLQCHTDVVQFRNIRIRPL